MCFSLRKTPCFIQCFKRLILRFFCVLKGGGDDEFSLRLMVLLLNGLYSVSVFYVYIYIYFIYISFGLLQ